MSETLAVPPSADEIISDLVSRSEAFDLGVEIKGQVEALLVAVGRYERIISTMRRQNTEMRDALAALVVANEKYPNWVEPLAWAKKVLQDARL